MDIRELKAYVATNRPESLGIVSYLDGVRAETLTAESIGDTIRLAEAQDALATLMGQKATFDFDVATMAARLRSLIR